ncbi:PREDICTED: uncharacterized protein LOC109373941 [Hipposideros armiger]|uniref:Uncharacterized protein LOC109373941 n=1 Tax=Hipposideros armiger TaxID=186990 RepID=A0A8B7Q4V6_HIPAR|nr:PREDICTED: uncharacterized protein LOC109373941 [Hipposideros armiger]
MSLIPKHQTPSSLSPGSAWVLERSAGRELPKSPCWRRRCVPGSRTDLERAARLKVHQQREGPPSPSPEPASHVFRTPQGRRPGWLRRAPSPPRTAAYSRGSRVSPRPSSSSERKVWGEGRRSGRELSERHLVILCRHEGSFLHEIPSWEQLEMRAVPDTEKVINKCLVFTNMNSRGVGHYEVRCIKMFSMDSSHWVLSSENEKTEVFSPRTFFVEVIVRSSHKALVPGKVRCALHDDISGASCVCFKFQIMGTWRMKN